MVAEHGGVGERRAARRIITSVELASGRRADEVETAVIINIDALSEVIAALEKGMTRGSFLQGGVGAALRRAVVNSEKVSGSDRSSVPSFLSGGTSDGGRYGPQSGEIVGILKHLIYDTSVDLQTLEKEELDQKTDHRSLVKAKTGETLAAPFVKVKGLITRLINKLQTEMSHVSYCDEETSMAAEKKEDLEDDTAKHSSTLETAVPSSTESVNEGHPDKICDQFSDVVLDASLPCDTKCKVACETCVKDNMFMVTSEITVAGKLHHETVVPGVIPQSLFVKKIGVIPETAEIPQSLSDVRGVVQNIEIDSFIDDLSSVGSQGSNRQDCEVLSHVGKQSGSTQQQQHEESNQQQSTRQVAPEKRRERGKERKGEGGKEEEGTEVEEAEREQVKKDVTGWTVVTRSKKHRKRTLFDYFSIIFDHG